jgi:uncharacterized protein YcbK (DUF882 family)
LVVIAPEIQQRSISVRCLLALLVVFGSAGRAVAAPAAHKSADKGTVKTCSEDKTGKKTCKRIAVFSGHNAAKTALRAAPLDRPTGEVWLVADNLGEEVHASIYKADGSFDDATLAKLDVLFRCIKTGEVRAVRAQLYEQLSRIYDHFGKPVHLVSGFRFAERDSSRHHHASAMDIRIPGVSIHTLQAFAESLDLGGEGAMGIGIYPTSDFVHVDFRAPGEPSFRWVDYSGHSPAKKPGRSQPARKPVS